MPSRLGLLLLLLVLVPALLAGCDGDATPTSQATAVPSPTVPRTPTPSSTAAPTPTVAPTATGVPDPTPTPRESGPLVDQRLWGDALLGSLWVREEVLRPGDMLNVRVRVENVSDVPVGHTLFNLEDPPIYTSLEQPYGNPVVLRSPEDPDMVSPALGYGVLEPGEGLEREVAWDVTIPAGGSAIPAPNGLYTVAASFFPGKQDGPAPDPLGLSYQVRVVGGDNVILPAEASQRFRALEAVLLWRGAHTGRAVARVENGLYFVNLGGRWEQASREAYQQALKETAPWPEPVLEPGRWTFQLASKYGFPPSELAVSLETATGEPVRVQPDLMADLMAELRGGVVATFQVGRAGGQRFQVFLSHPEAVGQVLALQRGESTASIPIGPLRPGPGPGLHNAPWSWHLAPLETRMAQFTIELCDGTPQFVEDDLDYWMANVRLYCPWTAVLVDLQDYR